MENDRERVERDMHSCHALAARFDEWRSAVEMLKQRLDTADAFHKSAVAERNLAWTQLDALKQRLAAVEAERDAALARVALAEAWLAKDEAWGVLVTAGDRVTDLQILIDARNAFRASKGGE